jgi:tetratricopeptide (TPR) repeat protein
VVAPAALQQAEQQVAAENIPEPLRPYYIRLYAEGKQNEVLHAMNGGLVAMRLGYFEHAQRLFDRAITVVEALQEGAAQAQRAQSKFVREQEKWFKGESYERSALYFYRGCLYLRDNDFGNAAACFKRSEINDITGEEARGFAGDWTSSELGLALASYKNGAPTDATAALERTARFPRRPSGVEWPRPSHNRVIVVEAGEGPRKYRAGSYGEYLKFQEGPCAVAQIEVAMVSPVYTSAAAEDLYYQATTRGERRVDAILNGKAQFKGATDTAGDAMLVGGAVAASTGTEAGGWTGLGLAVGGLIAKGVSAATTPEADIRSWQNLPHSLFFLPVTAPAEGGEVVLRARGFRGEAGSSLRVKIPPLAEGKTVDVLFVQF